MTVTDLRPIDTTPTSKLRGPDNRWRPTRAGLLNVWQYEDETFQFEKGRFVLYGPNGSGKTMALELLFPYLLDANAQPARLSTAGGNERGGLWSRVSGYEEINGKVGYLWAEFRRDTGTGPEYFTCGTRLETRSSGGRQSWFTTDRRIGDDLSLFDTNRIPLTVAALRERLEGHGKVWGDDVRGYKTAVRTTIYASFSEDRYQALLDGLLAVRKQSITDGLTDKRLNELLTEGLPALDAHELDQVARGFEQLDSRRATIEDLELAVKATDALDRRVVTYARGALRASAAIVSAAETRHDRVTKERNANEIALNEAEASISNAKHRSGQLVDSERELKGKDLAIRASAQYRSIDELDARRQTAERSEATARREAGHADRTEKAAAKAEQEAASDQTEVERTAGVAAETARGLAVDAKRAALDITVGDDLAKAAIAYQYAVDLKEKAIDEVRSKLTAVNLATQHRTYTDNARNDAARALTDAQQAQRTATTTATKANEAWVDHVRTWRDGLTELIVELVELAEITAVVDLGGFRDLAATAREQAARTLGREIDALEGRRRDLVATKTELETERDGLEHGGAVLQPSVPPWRQPRDSARAGAPLWAVVDVVDPDGDLAGLEAALHAAGVLDLFVAAADKTPAVGDTTSRTAAPADGPSLADVLRVDTEAAIAADIDPDRVTDVLRAISLSDTGTPTLAVTENGTFAYGPVAGTGATEPARYIGATARERARQARVAELTAEIDDLDGQIAELKEETQALEGRVKLADAEHRAAPSGNQVREARRALDRASDRVDVAQGAADKAEEAYQAAEDAVRQAIVALNRASSQYGLSTEERELNRLAANLRTIHRTAGNLAAEAVAVTGAERAAKRSAAAAAERRNEADAQAAVSLEAAGNAREDTAAYEQLHRTVGAGAKEAEAALDKVTKQLKKLTAERQELQGELERLNKAQGIAEEALKTSEREAAEAESARDTAGAAFRALAVNGLPNDGRIDLGDEALTNVSSILRAARLVNRAVPEEPDANRLASQLLQLDDERHKAQTELAAQAEIGLTQIEGTGEQLPVSRAFATVEGVDMTISDLAKRFANDLDRARRELEAKETELFEQTLTGSLRAHLASRLRAAQGLVDGMNDLLATIRTASGGVAVSLRWEVSDQVDDQDTLTKIKNLLLQDHHTDTERSTLFEFLARRIDLVRSDDRAAGSWKDALEQLFDYRRWHRFRLMVRHDRFGDRPVAFSSRNVSLSAGEKSLVLSLPLFAAIASHYMPRDSEGDAPACPRLVLLDEVFPKNDRPNKRQILRLLTDLDLDCVLTSDKDMCDYDTVDGIAIAVIAKDGDASFATRLVWNGTETVPEPPSIEP